MNMCTPDKGILILYEAGEKIPIHVTHEKSPTENIQESVTPTLKLSENRKLIIQKLIAWQALVCEMSGWKAGSLGPSSSILQFFCAHTCHSTLGTIMTDGIDL